MHRIIAIAVNTFREAVRDRVLHGLIGVSTAILIFTLALAEVALDQQLRIVLDVGLASISLFAVLVSVFLGSSLLYKEIERKTLYIILPKPVRRWEFLLGKYFGIALTAFVFIAIMGAVQLCVTSVQADADPWLVGGAAVGMLVVLGLAMWLARDRTAVVVPWSVAAFGVAAAVASTVDAKLGAVLGALVLSMGEVLMLTAVALFFSSFSTPFVTALLCTGVWIVGRSADVMSTMKSPLIPDFVRHALRHLVYYWPNFNLFVPGRHTLETQLAEGAGPLSYVANNMLYAAGYSVVVLTIAALVFRRRDFI